MSATLSDLAGWIALAGIALAYVLYRKHGRRGNSTSKENAAKEAASNGGIAPNEITLALIRLLGAARFARMRQRGDIDSHAANEMIERLKRLPPQVLMGIPEATILWVCSEYLRLTDLGMARPDALRTIETHRGLLTGVDVCPSIESRWLRSYVALRVANEHSNIEYSRDFAMLATEFVINRLKQPMNAPTVSAEPSPLHPLAVPIPFGVLESAELYVEAMEAALLALDKGTPRDAFSVIDQALGGLDAQVLTEADRKDLLENQAKFAQMPSSK